VTTTEQALTELKARFGARWQIWYVPHALDGGVTWCARRWDADYRHNLHAHTPAELGNTSLRPKPGTDRATRPGAEPELPTFRSKAFATFTTPALYFQRK